MSTQFETERKYTADGAALPALDTVPGVTETTPAEPENLEAVYFDTADLRLARWGLTFRRRQGGHDDGWHLKLPAGQDTRRELHRPLGTGEPPEGLVALLAGVTRGVPLVPVARISTDRRRRLLRGGDRAVLAELTEDRVSGQRLRAPAPADEWSEVEVELTEGTGTGLLDAIEAKLAEAGIHRSGDTSKLARVLGTRTSARAPGRRAGAGEAVLSYLTDQVGALIRQDVLVRDHADDAVHQLRLAARRIRGTLRVYGKIVDRRRTGALSAELRWLTDTLGPARDLEVLDERIHGRIEALPDRLVIGPIHTQLTRYFGPKHQAADRAVRQAIGTPRYTALLDALDDLVAHPPLTRRAARAARAELPTHLRKAYRRVDRRLRAADARPTGKAHDTALHRVRKAAKRLRYALEAAEPVLGTKARKARTRAKKLTSVLGDMQDSVVARPVLRKLGAATHVAGANGFTFGLLHAHEQATAEHAETELITRRAKLRKRTAWLR